MIAENMRRVPSVTPLPLNNVLTGTQASQKLHKASTRIDCNFHALILSPGMCCSSCCIGECVLSVQCVLCMCERCHNAGTTTAAHVMLQGFGRNYYRRSTNTMMSHSVMTTDISAILSTASYVFV